MSNAVSVSKCSVRTPDFPVNLQGWYHGVFWGDSDFSGCRSASVIWHSYRARLFITTAASLESYSDPRNAIVIQAALTRLERDTTKSIPPQCRTLAGLAFGPTGAAMCPSTNTSQGGFFWFSDIG